ncbi:MAG TPA: T9SS type A sorting domain-containing protein [Bacteroidetes bacterium]|nr:T9SS type A sorting domain-containing protein [Bacteroidota bacterium]
MKTLIKALIAVCASMPVVMVYSQPFTQQILNKSPIFTNVAHLQDYDNDGDLDIILLQDDPAAVLWLENEPTLQFPRHYIITENITRTRDLDIADFDNDGDMDYLVCSRATAAVMTGGELVWHQRQDDGTYIKWTIDTGADFNMAAVADFNNDGWLDIAAVGFWNNSFSIYINQGNLFFNEIVQPYITPQATQINADDIDGDGDMDIVFDSAMGSNGIGSHIAWNDGAGTFTLGPGLSCWNSSNFDCGNSDGKFEIVDINNDGAKDILTFGGIGLGGLYWLDGANNFQKTLIENFHIDSKGDLLAFDVDGNGLKDIIKQDPGAEGFLSVLYQTDNMVFEKEFLEIYWNANTGGNGQMTYGDLDNDGDDDLIFPEHGNIDGDISWFENIDGKLIRHYLSNQAMNARIPKFADVDNDGDDDILVTLAASGFAFKENEVMLYENMGNNTFINWRINDSLDYAADIEPADIDGDGDLDAFVTAKDATDLVWLENNGNNYNWPVHIIDENVNQALGIVSVDIDMDGDNDVVLCSNNDDKLFWYNNNGTGSFSKNVLDSNIDAPREVEAADLDDDGDIDIALASIGLSNTVAIYWNDGSENFSRQIYFTDKSAYDIEIADWNNDLLPDILFSLNTSPTSDPKQEVVSLINNGSQNFTALPLIVQAEKGTSLKIEDLDNDGDKDLVIGRDNSQRLTIWLQSPNGLTQAFGDEQGAFSSEVYGIDISDADHDGIMDIVYPDFIKDEIILLSFGCADVPAVDLGPDIEIQQGGATTLDASGTGLTYLWSTGDTTSTIVVNMVGTYSVTVTNAAGCTAEDEVMVDVVSATKASEYGKLVEMYPNPSDDIIFVEYKNMPAFTVHVLDCLGNKLQTVIPDNVQNGKIKIDLSGFPPGIYYFSFKGSFVPFVKRVVKI